MGYSDWFGVFITTLGTCALAGASAHGAEAIEDGFYETSSDLKAPRIVDVSGMDWRVGPRLEVTNRFVDVISVDNWNERFRLGIALPKRGADSIPPLKSPPETLLYSDGQWNVLLTVDGHWYRLGLLRSETEGVVGDWLFVEGRGHAERIARHFSVKPYFRKHAGHQIAAKFEPLMSAVLPDHPVKVKMTLQNVGTKAVSFFRGLHRETHTLYSFVVTKDTKTLAGDVVLGWGGFDQSTWLKPGEKFTDEVDLNNWFNLTETGEYEVECFYALMLRDTVNAERITWTDAVGGYFEVAVVEGPARTPKRSESSSESEFVRAFGIFELGFPDVEAQSVSPIGTVE